MGIELQLNFGLASLKVGLAEFEAVAKTLSGAAKQEAARADLKGMIEEVRKSYDTVVGVLTPLYEIDSKRKFSNRFAKTRSDFKSVYLRGVGATRTHCTVIKTRLEALKKRRGWMKRTPFTRQAYERLKHFCEQWAASDEALVLHMDGFLREMSQFLDRVARLRRKDPAEAFAYMETALTQWEDEFVALERRLASLQIVSDTL